MKTHETVVLEILKSLEGRGEKNFRERMVTVYNKSDLLSAAQKSQAPESRRLISASADLYARVKRLDDGGLEADAPQSPARALMGRLERGLGGQSG